jgi:hypothetical protein
VVVASPLLAGGVVVVLEVVVEELEPEGVPLVVALVVVLLDPDVVPVVELGAETAPVVVLELELELAGMFG